jgi:hypothetical protein
MLGNYQLATQVVASRVELTSIELVRSGGLFNKTACSDELNSVLFREKRAVTTGKLVNHLSICLGTEEIQETTYRDGRPQNRSVM